MQNINIMDFLIKVEEECNNNNNNSQINKMLNQRVVKNLLAKKDNKLIIFLEEERIISANLLQDQLNKHQVNNKIIFLIKSNNLNHSEMRIDKDKWLVIVSLEVLIIVSLLKEIVIFFIIILKK